MSKVCTFTKLAPPPPTFHGSTALDGRDLTVKASRSHTLRNTTLGSTPLDE